MVGVDKVIELDSPLLVAKLKLLPRAITLPEVITGSSLGTIMLLDSLLVNSVPLPEVITLPEVIAGRSLGTITLLVIAGRSIMLPEVTTGRSRAEIKLEVISGKSLTVVSFTNDSSLILSASVVASVARPQVPALL
jgi:hypothetical protein